MPSYPLQNLCIAVIAGTPVIAAAFVGLRIYARRHSRIALGWDDYLVVLALILSVALIGPSVKNVYMWHMGIHIWDVDQYHLEPNYVDYHKVLIAYNLIYTPILPLVKASIIMLLLRAGWVIAPIRTTLYCILTFVVLACFGPWMALIFLCPPRTGETSLPTVFNGLSCLTPKQGGVIYVFLVTANMFTDLLVLPIPSLLVYRIRNASVQSRLTVVFSFALSLGVTAMGAVRLKLNYQSILYHVHVSDWTYSIVYCLSHAENNVAILLACMPPLRSLILRWTSNKDEEAHVRDQSSTINRRIYGESFTLRPMTPIEDSKGEYHARIHSPPTHMSTTSYGTDDGLVTRILVEEKV